MSSQHRPRVHFSTSFTLDLSMLAICHMRFQMRHTEFQSTKDAIKIQMLILRFLLLGEYFTFSEHHCTTHVHMQWQTSSIDGTTAIRTSLLSYLLHLLQFQFFCQQYYFAFFSNENFGSECLLDNILSKIGIDKQLTSDYFYTAVKNRYKRSRTQQTQFLKLYIYLSLAKMILKKTNSQVFEKQDNGSQKSVKSSTSQHRKRVPELFTRQLQANSKRMKQQSSIGVKQIFQSALRMFVCTLCYSNVQMKDTGSIGECGHTFCVQCLTQYCIYKIKIHEDVLCPEENCTSKLRQNSQFFAYIPEQYQQKHKQNLLWKQTMDNPNIKLCQKQECKAGLVDMLKDPPQCQKCGIKYCKECMMESHEGPCDDNFGNHFRQWRRCPKCKMFIQKQEGCNHISCRCTHQFCYVCLGDWDEGHYQCVQGLSNRLFFNQAENVPKITAFFALIALILLVPIFIAGLVILGILAAAIASALGAIVSPCVLAKEMGSCCCCLPFFLILLPFAIVIGAIASPIFFIISNYKPFTHRIMRQHFNSISFLIGELKCSARR